MSLPSDVAYFIPFHLTLTWIALPSRTSSGPSTSNCGPKLSLFFLSLNWAKAKVDKSLLGFHEEVTESPRFAVRAAEEYRLTSVATHSPNRLLSFKLSSTAFPPAEKTKNNNRTGTSLLVNIVQKR